jgi:hypothetical protein
MEAKTLQNTDADSATKNVKDIKFFGDGDTFKLICKASSENEGWMKSTKAMEIEGAGVVVQVTTQQRNYDGSYAVAEALTFVPYAKIEDIIDDTATLVGRRVVADKSMFMTGVSELKLYTDDSVDGGCKCTCGRE